MSHCHKLFLHVHVYLCVIEHEWLHNQYLHILNRKKFESAVDERELEIEGTGQKMLELQQAK